MESQGCKPPYWNSISALPPCRKMEQMKEMVLMYWNDNIDGKSNTFDAIGRPCRMLENVQYDMSDIDHLDKANESFFEIRLMFKAPTYKEIKRVRAMDLQALIGNVL